MKEPKHSFEPRGNYIGGEFRSPEDKIGEWKHVSPANLEDVLGEIEYSHEDVDRAVQAARDAYKPWRDTALSQKIECLKRYQSALKENQERLAETISREMGKPLWEAKTEASAMMGKVDITINESLKWIPDLEIANAAPGAFGTCRYKSMGVMAVIGPFNFPGHLANGHIVPALLTGNTVIFKPSEKTPLTGQIMAECFEAGGFPKGVFNLLQGEKEVSRRLCVHEGVAGVLFTGSYEVGTRIKQDTLQQHWKLLALEMGGKNASIIWEDADLEVALREVFFSAFVTTGQRCSCTSRVIVHKKLFEQFMTRFHERAKAFEIGHPLDDPFMGPLIDQSSVDRYLKFQGIGARESGEVIMHGKKYQSEVPGYYVTPSICWVKDSSVDHAKKSVYQQTELFAPNVALLETEDLDHAIELANCTEYGLVNSVFTADKQVFDRCWTDLESGLINWNKSTVGASSKLPFGGTKKSGNHWPTAVSASRYCTYPVASLEVSDPAPDAPKFPGINWE